MTASTNVIKKFSYPVKYFRTFNKNFDNKCLFIGHSNVSLLNDGIKCHQRRLSHKYSP